MAGSPILKVYTAEGEYVAACWHPEDAAALVAIYGDGATIRRGHLKRDIVWTEGAEDTRAGESFDLVAATVNGRINRARSAQTEEPR